MLSAEAFDALEFVARAVRRDPRPLGGVRLVRGGDFLQLPPVGRAGAPPPRFAFQAASWGRCVQQSFVLGTVFRQTDGAFISLLSKLREGACPPADLAELLAGCRRALPAGDGILPTRLFTHRADCDAINATELAQLPGARLWVGRVGGRGCVWVAARGAARVRGGGVGLCSACARRAGPKPPVFLGGRCSPGVARVARQPSQHAPCSARRPWRAL